MNYENKDNILETDSYELTSFSEVDGVVDQIALVYRKNLLIHVISYIHNTVLVQNLLTGLKKKIPHAKVVCLKTKDKSKTVVKSYSLEHNLQDEFTSDEILKELDTAFLKTNQNLQVNKSELLNRYFTDHLTGFPNIYRLRKDMMENEEAGMILIKIDNFSIINNFYGFIIGDFVIEKVGEFLKEVLSEHKIYRYAGSEYVALLGKNMSFYDLKEHLSNIYKKLSAYSVDYQDINIFIEFSLSSCANSNNENIFSKVSMALNYANENNLPFWIYEDRMHFENLYEKNLNISSVVRYAVENSKIIPYFQPIINNKTMQIKKFECLARLIDEDDNVISPSLFISIAKKIKVYNLVTKTIIDKSFEAFKDNDYEFNINLSIEDIMSSDIFDFIVNKLNAYSSVANRVTFELLESEAIQDFQKVQRFITEVKRYGAKIAIDDFGDGYSNFSYLTKIDIDYIKIDGSIIKDIDVDKNSYLVAQTIVEFAKKFNIECVGEYVHSSTVLDKVKELGIEYSQGFYIDKPSLELSIEFN